MNDSSAGTHGGGKAVFTARSGRLAALPRLLSLDQSGELTSAHVKLVATAVGGIPDLVAEAALLVPPGDPDALAAAVRRVLTEPGLKAELAAAGIRRSRGWPDESAVQAELIKLYREWRVGTPPPIT